MVTIEKPTSPDSDPFIFEVKLDNATKNVTVKHVKSGKYFGKDNNGNIILVAKITNALCFKHQ